MRFPLTSAQACLLAGCLCGTLPLTAQGRGGGAAKGHTVRTPPAAEPRGRSLESRGPDQTHGKMAEGPDVSRRMQVSEHLARNEKLVTRLQPLFPEGTNLTEASSGFKNLGQFVAAAHVSKNLGIPFADVRTQMTGPANGSLGKAITVLKPDLPESEVKNEVRRAEKMAKEDIAKSKAEGRPDAPPSS